MKQYPSHPGALDWTGTFVPWKKWIKLRCGWIQRFRIQYWRVQPKFAIKFLKSGWTYPTKKTSIHINKKIKLIKPSTSAPRHSNPNKAIPPPKKWAAYMQLLCGGFALAGPGSCWSWSKIHADLGQVNLVGWLQPILKNLTVVKMRIFPKLGGEHKNSIWNHHLRNLCRNSLVAVFHSWISWKEQIQ